MSKEKTVFKDRTYRIIGGAPLSTTIPGRSSKRSKLLYFDEDSKQNREIRYAANQKSPFVDEQDGEALVEPIVFERGMLFVPKENQALQKFLHYHPRNGVKFEELDLERDAEAELDRLDLEDEAMESARSLNFEMLEMVYRVGMDRNPNKASIPEMKRDVRIFARNNPETFLDVVNDPKLQLHGKVGRFLDERVLIIRNKKEVYFNIKDNKKRMMILPFGAEPIQIISEFLQSDEGLPILAMLEKKLSALVA